MNRLFVCGDCHGDIDIGKVENFVMDNPDLDNSDVLMICGDWGVVWGEKDYDERMIALWSSFPFTTLVTLGNHENYDLFKNYEIVNIFCGEAYKIADKVYVALRGQVFEVNGKTFLSVSGADSHDKAWRVEGLSWWSGEIITEEDVEKTLENISKAGKIDYVITHTGGSETIGTLNLSFLKSYMDCTRSDNNLDKILEKIDYKYHFCGHYHVDSLCENNIILYDRILEIHEDDSITCVNCKAFEGRDVTKLVGLENLDFWNFNFVTKEEE